MWKLNQYKKIDYQLCEMVYVSIIQDKIEMDFQCPHMLFYQDGIRFEFVH